MMEGAPALRLRAQLDDRQASTASHLCWPGGGLHHCQVPPEGVATQAQGGSTDHHSFSPSDRLFGPAVGPRLEGLRVLDHEVYDVPHVRVGLLNR